MQSRAFKKFSMLDAFFFRQKVNIMCRSKHQKLKAFDSSIIFAEFGEFYKKIDQCSGRLILGNMWTAMTSIPCGGSNIQNFGGLVEISITIILPPSAETAHTFPRRAHICSAPFRWFVGPISCSQQSLSSSYLLKDPVS